uniref:Uncharacterized protein n=1 Tax=Rhizophora mucronata TaxID=61149 RepID=A0A2P2QH03_RHIMU
MICIPNSWYRVQWCILPSWTHLKPGSEFNLLLPYKRSSPPILT